MARGGGLHDGLHGSVEIVAAVARDTMVIGDGTRLPWHIKEDLAHFRALTAWHIVVMGRKTYASIPNAPLKDRINIVVTSTMPEAALRISGDDGVDDAAPCRCAFVRPRDVDRAIESARARFPEKRVFVIGGARMYEAFLPRAARLHITRIDKAVDGDVKFPAFQGHHRLVCCSDVHYSEAERCHFQFCTYERR